MAASALGRRDGGWFILNAPIMIAMNWVTAYLLQTKAEEQSLPRLAVFPGCMHNRPCWSKEISLFA